MSQISPNLLLLYFLLFTKSFHFCPLRCIFLFTALACSEGSFYLPYIHYLFFVILFRIDVTEGQLGFCGIYLVAAFMGGDIWIAKVCMPFGYFFVVVIKIIMMIIIYYHNINNNNNYKFTIIIVLILLITRLVLNFFFRVTSRATYVSMSSGVQMDLVVARMLCQFITMCSRC